VKPGPCHRFCARVPIARNFSRCIPRGGMSRKDAFLADRRPTTRQRSGGNARRARPRACCTSCCQGGERSNSLRKVWTAKRPLGANFRRTNVGAAADTVVALWRKAVVSIDNYLLSIAEQCLNSSLSGSYVNSLQTCNLRRQQRFGPCAGMQPRTHYDHRVSSFWTLAYRLMTIAVPIRTRYNILICGPRLSRRFSLMGGAA